MLQGNSPQNRKPIPPIPMPTPLLLAGRAEGRRCPWAAQLLCSQTRRASLSTAAASLGLQGKLCPSPHLGPGNPAQGLCSLQTPTVERLLVMNPCASSTARGGATCLRGIGPALCLQGLGTCTLGKQPERKGEPRASASSTAKREVSSTCLSRPLGAVGSPCLDSWPLSKHRVTC